MSPFRHVTDAIKKEAQQRAYKNGRNGKAHDSYLVECGIVQGLELAIEIINRSKTGDPLTEED